MKLTEGDLSKHIRALAIPICIAFFFNTMFNITDTFFAGMISTDALAALSISFPIFLLIVSIDQGISIGALALIGNALGSQGRENPRQYIFQAVSFGVVCALCLTVGGIFVSTPLLTLLGASGNYLELSKIYIHIIFFGCIFMIMNSVANAILMAHGRPQPMRNYLTFAFFANVGLDPLFMYGWWVIPPLGLSGIAYATIFTLFCGTLYMLSQVICYGCFKEGKWADFIPQPHIFLAMLQQGVPASLNMMSIAIGMFVLTYYVKTFGSASVAALGIGLRLQQIVLLPSIGLSIAAISIISQNNGAGLYDRVEKTAQIAMKYGILLVGSGALVLLLIPRQLMLLFSENEQVVSVGTTYLRFSALTLLGYLIMSIKISMLQAMKRPNFAFFIGATRQVVAPIFTFYLLIHTFHLGIESIWIAIFCVTWIAAFISVIYANQVLLSVKSKNKN